MVIPDGRSDKWTPPPWHAPPQAGETSPTVGAARSRGTSRPERTALSVDAARPIILGFAIAPAATGVVALLLVFVEPLSGSGSVPYALVLLCVLQIVCYLAIRNGEAAILARSWLIVLTVTSGLLPLLSLQSELIHEQYVAWSRQSALPAAIATFAVVLFVVVAAIWCVVAFSSMPEVAEIAYLPVALIVPGILGIGTTIDQRAALEGLAESSLFAAGATVLAWSLPRAVRLIVPTLAMAVQVAALWAAGRGPSFPETSGGIVNLLYWATVVTAVALVVFVPVAAAWLQHAIAAVENEERPRPFDAGEGET
jgi:hypothetical protein